MTDANFSDRPLVLLLEDEPILAMSLMDYIEEAGCEVIEARGTADAIRLLEERSDIRIVVADLDTRGSVMGMKLAMLIRERWPPVELILTSSAPRAPLAHELPGRGVYFGKPFDGSQVVSLIRDFARPAQAS